MRNEEIKAFLQNLRMNFGKKSANLLLILEASAFSYSVIRKLGSRLHYPVALVYDSMESLDKFAAEMGIFEKRFLSCNCAASRFKKVLTDGKDDFVMFRYAKGKISDENLALLFQALLDGHLEGKELVSLPIVAFEQFIPDYQVDNFSIVVKIEGTMSDVSTNAVKEKFSAKLSSWLIENFKILAYESRKLVRDSGKNEVRDWDFFSTIILLLEMADGKGVDPSYEDFGSVLRDEVVKASRERLTCDLRGQVDEIFRDLLVAALPSISGIVEKGMMTQFDGAEKETTILFDSRCYYFPEKLFRKICHPFAEVCSVDEIKAALEQADILCTQGQGRVYRTIKLQMNNTTARYVWLRRDKIDGSAGDLTLVEWIKIRKEER